MADDEKPAKSETGQRQSGVLRIVSIINFSVLAVVMFVVLLLSLISLGTFGKKQAQLEDFLGGKGCFLSSERTTFLGLKTLRFTTNYGPCGFIFWGWSSVAIVAIFFIIYLIVLAILGSNL